MGEIRISVSETETVGASALRYDAECNREVAASMRERSRRARIRAIEMRDESAAVRAESELALARARRLRQSR